MICWPGALVQVLARRGKDRPDRIFTSVIKKIAMIFMYTRIIRRPAEAVVMIVM